MRKTLLSMLVLLLACSTAQAQHLGDSTAFRGYLYNAEYEVYLQINLYEQDVVIGWQEMYGALPGYLCKPSSNYCWIITSAETNGTKASLEMVNDTGSDDLSATLTQENDSTFILRQGHGATIKVPNKGKWQKLPSTMTFVKRKNAK